MNSRGDVDPRFTEANSLERCNSGRHSAILKVNRDRTIWNDERTWRIITRIILRVREGYYFEGGGEKALNY